MADILSTGLVNALQADYGFKQAMWDGVIDIYSGTQPTTANDVPNGTKLARITVSSGAWTAGTMSTRRQDQVAIVAGSTGNTYALVINGTTYSYVQIGGDTATTIATALVALVDGKIVSVSSLAGTITVRAKFGGVDYTIANTGSTTPGNIVITSVTANSSTNGLKCSTASAGVLSKDAQTWSGSVLVSGTAGWARFKANPLDDDSSSSTLLRYDGAVSTSNATFILSNVTLTAGTTVTVDSATFTCPTQ